MTSWGTFQFCGVNVNVTLRPRGLALNSATDWSELVSVTVTSMVGWDDNVTSITTLSSFSTLSASVENSTPATSSLRMVRPTSSGLATPRPPLAVADTVKALSSSARPLSTAETVTVPVLVVAPAEMVSVLPLLRLKSLAVAGATAVAATVRVTSSLEGPLKRAVTSARLAEPFSSMVERESCRLTVGRGSSSTISMLPPPVTFRPPDFPLTLRLSFGSSIVSLTGFRLKLRLAFAAPSGILSDKFATSA